MRHQHHALHLVADVHQVRIDAVGNRQPFVTVKHVVAVTLLLGCSLSFKRIAYLGVVHDVHEVAHQLLGLHHKVAQFI